MKKIKSEKIQYKSNPEVMKYTVVDFIQILQTYMITKCETKDLICFKENNAMNLNVPLNK